MSSSIVFASICGVFGKGTVVESLEASFVFFCFLFFWPAQLGGAGRIRAAGQQAGAASQKWKITGMLPHCASLLSGSEHSTNGKRGDRANSRYVARIANTPFRDPS